MAVVIANSMVVGKLNAGKLRPKKPGDIDAPNQLTAEQAAELQSARQVSSQQAAQISAPNQISAEQASQIQAARELDAINAKDIAAPNIINSIPDSTSPPFPLNHARILYDNKLSDATSTSSSGPLALTPNTYEYSSFGAAVFTIPENRDIDCIAIGAGDYAGKEVVIQTSDSESGGFATRAVIQADNNKAIMILFDKISVRRVRFSFGARTRIGVISAGIALQMQRPIFGGHNPITMSRQTEYQSRRSESGNFVSRNIIRKGLSGSYEWSNLTDDWVREYFDPFIESARKLPFFIAWRPESYPDEVAYAWTTGDISPSNIGTRNLMSVGMDVQAYGD